MERREGEGGRERRKWEVAQNSNSVPSCKTTVYDTLHGSVLIAAGRVANTYSSEPWEGEGEGGGGEGPPFPWGP